MIGPLKTQTYIGYVVCKYTLNASILCNTNNLTIGSENLLKLQLKDHYKFFNVDVQCNVVWTLMELRKFWGGEVSIKDGGNQ
jgi:hypothetical protein